MHARMGLVLSLWCLAACGSGEATAPSTSRSTSSVPPPSLAPTASAEPAPTIAETDVRALVTSWLAAQNGGDFAAYGALYATRFDGIRRAGPRVRRFDREGWMSDRRGMFSRTIHVEARDVTVSVLGNGATVHLTQSFTEGTFHDEGPKELTVIREAGGLRIAREEMIASTLGAAVPPAPLAAGALLPVVTAGGQRFAVITPVPEGADWHEGAPELLEREGVVVTRASARPAAVPATLAAVAGQPVRLGDAHGTECDATLGALAVLSRVDVHFGVEAVWNGQNDDGTQGTPSTPAQIARDAWGEGMLLVASVPAGACPDASFARLASLSPTPAFAATPADTALSARVLAAFRALGVWAAMQTSYTESGGTDAHWDTITAPPSVTVWAVPSATRRFAVLTVSAGDGGCADFSASVWSVFEIAADGSLTRLTDASDPGYFSPLGATDVDGDGRPEWIVERGIVGAVGNGLGLVVDTSAVVHDCYC